MDEPLLSQLYRIVPPPFARTRYSAAKSSLCVK